MVVTRRDGVNRFYYNAGMGWLVFTAVDLYMGVVLIDLLARSESLPEPKRRRLQSAKRITLALFALTVMGIVLKWFARRWM
ncbi:MAG TPA: hypothetical protein VFA68_20810 [Terriglobales bacterium]|nr:hypothetical protein [Terriglobales bacterium]